MLTPNAFLNDQQKHSYKEFFFSQYSELPLVQASKGGHLSSTLNDVLNIN